MESNSIKNQIHLSDTAAKIMLKQDATLNIQSRGVITIKGKGKMATSWLAAEGQVIGQDQGPAANQAVRFASRIQSINPAQGSQLTSRQPSNASQQQPSVLQQQAAAPHQRGATRHARASLAEVTIADVDVCVSDLDGHMEPTKSAKSRFLNVETAIDSIA